MSCWVLSDIVAVVICKTRATESGAADSRRILVKRLVSPLHIARMARTHVVGILGLSSFGKILLHAAHSEAGTSRKRRDDPTSEDLKLARHPRPHRV